MITFEKGKLFEDGSRMRGKIIFFLFCIILSFKISVAQTDRMRMCKAYFLLPITDTAWVSMGKKHFFSKNDTLLKASTEQCLMALNYENGDLTVKIKLNSIVTGIALIDSALSRLSEQSLVFSGNLNVSTFTLLRTENTDVSYNVTGTLSLNNMSRPISAKYALGKINAISPTDNELDFIMDIPSIDFGLANYSTGLKNNFTVYVKDGFLNSIK
jgi:hypothetical protein